MWNSEPDLAAIASLVAEPARAAIVSELFDGRALPAGELARVARVSPATASAHLAKLVDGGLLTVFAQGRHRYYHIASADVAHALETLGALAPRQSVKSLRGAIRAERLRNARSCYDHLAGRIAIALATAFVERGVLQRDGDGFRLGANGCVTLHELGVDYGTIERGDAHIRGCLDWTERRPHIGGALGRAILDAFLQRGYFERITERRVLQLTPAGEEMLRGFGVVSTQSETKAG
ncbi:MAG: helix-turn-helix transcriptional regulator [Candidatus Eremiobacteraeota bacterium]|nr:helix-turn-helix transcriptional regulator [Candidatus Eremiobacteraeota bacterium]